MANLIGMITLALATMALWFSRKQNWASQHRIAFRLALIVAYSWTFLLALRFGARTYPGVFMGRSDALNAIFNSSQIFWTGYEFVAVAALADLLSVLFARGSTSGSEAAVRTATTTRNVLLLLAALGATYGFYFAIILERLPG